MIHNFESKAYIGEHLSATFLRGASNEIFHLPQEYTFDNLMMYCGGGEL